MRATGDLLLHEDEIRSVARGVRRGGGCGDGGWLRARAVAFLGCHPTKTNIAAAASTTAAAITANVDLDIESSWD